MLLLLCLKVLGPPIIDDSTTYMLALKFNVHELNLKFNSYTDNCKIV